MFSLIPREDAFFTFFEEAAANLLKGARIFSVLPKDSSELKEQVDLIREIEHLGDAITQKTIDRVNRTFVTPIDREDIYALISRLDTVLDWIDQASSLFVMYKLKDTPQEIYRMGEILVKACEAVQGAVASLRDSKKWNQAVAICRGIREQEKLGDQMIREGLGSLFEKEKDPIRIIKWKEVYEDLENALDAAEDVANVIEGIVIKST